jgi:hypothetical protein
MVFNQVMVNQAADGPPCEAITIRHVIALEASEGVSLKTGVRGARGQQAHLTGFERAPMPALSRFLCSDCSVACGRGERDSGSAVLFRRTD